MLVDQAKNANATATDEVLFQAEESALFKARAITTGVLVAIGLIFWGPYFFYKRVVSFCTLPPEKETSRGSWFGVSRETAALRQPSQHTRQRMPAEDPRQRSGGPSVNLILQAIWCNTNRKPGRKSQPLPSNAPPPSRFSSRSQRTRRTSTRRHASLK